MLPLTRRWFLDVCGAAPFGSLFPLQRRESSRTASSRTELLTDSRMDSGSKSTSAEDDDFQRAAVPATFLLPPADILPCTRRLAKRCVEQDMMAGAGGSSSCHQEIRKQNYEKRTTFFASKQQNQKQQVNGFVLCRKVPRAVQPKTMVLWSRQEATGGAEGSKEDSVGACQQKPAFAPLLPLSRTAKPACSPRA